MRWTVMVAAIMCCALLVAGCGERRSRQQSDLGDTHLRLGNIERAVEAYQRALDADSGNLEARMGLARCYAIQDDEEQALEAYQMVRDADPLYHDAYVESIEILLGDDRESEARDLARTYAEVAPEKGGILLAYIDQETGRRQDGMRRLVALRDQMPESAAIRIALARAYLVAGEPSNAESEIQAILEDIDPGSLSARMALIEVYQQQGRVDDIVDQFAQMATDQPEDTGIQLAYARSLLFVERFDEAEAIARPILEDMPESGWANFIVGACHLNRGEHREAVACFQAAMHSLPQEPMVTELLEVAQTGGDMPSLGRRPERRVAVTQPEAPDEGWQDLWQMANLVKLIAERDAFLATRDKDARDAIFLASIFLRRMDVVEELSAEIPEEDPLNQYAVLLQSGDAEAMVELLQTWEESEPFRAELRDLARGFMLGLGGARAAALQAFSECLANRPNNGVPLLLLSMMFDEADMPEFEIKGLEQLARMHPDSFEVQNLLFARFLSTGKLDDARNQAQLTYTLFPERPQALSNLAAAYRSTGELDLAIDILERAVEKLPDDAELKLQYAETLIDDGQFAQADARLDAITEPESAVRRAHILRAFSAALQGNWSPAATLSDAVELDTLSVSARILVAAAQVEQGYPQEALGILRDAEGNLLAQGRLAAVYEALGQSTDDIPEAQVTLGNALGEDRDALVEHMLALSLLDARFYTAALPILQELDSRMGYPEGLIGPKMNALAQARLAENRIQLAREYVERHPSSVGAWLGLATIADNEGDLDVQNEALERATEVDPNRADAWFRLAILRDKQEDYSDALAIYERLTELESESPAFLNNRAYAILQTNGDPEEAVGFAQRARDIMGPNPHVLHTLGLAQLRAGSLDEAQQNLGMALEMRPGDPTLLLDYGEVLIALGNGEAGRSHIVLALRYADQLGLDFPRRPEAVAALEREATA